MDETACSDRSSSLAISFCLRPRILRSMIFMCRGNSFLISYDIVNSHK